VNNRVLRNILKRSRLIIVIGLLISANFLYASRAYVGGGTAYFTDNGYTPSYNSFKYIVQNGPPNTCGTLVLDRNGVHEVSPNWLCTNGSGYAEKGPYYPNRDETAVNIRIEWPDGSRTTGGEFHYQDVTPPGVRIDPAVSGGNGAPIPASFYGRVTDTRWGPGHDFRQWSFVHIAYYNRTTNKFYNSSQGCYCSTSPQYFSPSVSPLVGYNLGWTTSPPPQSAHNKTDSYEWYVQAKDLYYYSNAEVVYFNGPRP
jgi:hypothetical protein